MTLTPSILKLSLYKIQYKQKACIQLSVNPANIVIGESKATFVEILSAYSFLKNGFKV